jgi:hypothetical protein
MHSSYKHIVGEYISWEPLFIVTHKRRNRNEIGLRVKIKHIHGGRKSPVKRISADYMLHSLLERAAICIYFLEAGHIRKHESAGQSVRQIKSRNTFYTANIVATPLKVLESPPTTFSHERRNFDKITNVHIFIQ